MLQMSREEEERKQALEEIFFRYGGMMSRVVRGILPPQEAEECLAQVWFRLWEALPTYDEEKGSLATWLTALCRHAAIDQRRKLQRRNSHEAELDPGAEDPAMGPEEALFRREASARLRKTMEGLRKEDLELFRRKYDQKQSTAQIAQELGMSVRAVEGRLRRIRRRLKSLLTEEDRP